MAGFVAAGSGEKMSRQRSSAVEEEKVGEPDLEVVKNNSMDKFAPSNDHIVLLQGHHKSNISSGVLPKKPRFNQRGGIGNHIGYNGSRTINKYWERRNVCPQPQKEETTAPMDVEPSICRADENLGISNVADEHHASQFPNAGIPSSKGGVILTQNEHNDEQKDLFYCDSPYLDGCEDFETMFRNSGPVVEPGNIYAENLSLSSISSQDVGAHPVPSGCLFDKSNLINVVNEKPSDPALTSSTPIVDTANQAAKSVCQEQNDMISTVDIRQSSAPKIMDGPLHFEKHTYSSSMEIDQFLNYSDPDIFCQFGDLTNTKTISSCEGLEAIFCSTQDLLVPATSSIMCEDENVCSSSCTEPDIVAAHIPHLTRKSQSPFSKTPDMILDEMAERSLQEYLPALSSRNDQPQMLMNPTAIQKHQFSDDCEGKDVLNSKGMGPPTLCENPGTSLILEALPVKDLGFQKLQDGMNQLGVRTKTCIRDALYRLADSVEQKHCTASTTNSVRQLTNGSVESSGSKRFKASKLTRIVADPNDRSEADEGQENLDDDDDDDDDDSEKNSITDGPDTSSFRAFLISFLSSSSSNKDSMDIITEQNGEMGYPTLTPVGKAHKGRTGLLSRGKHSIGKIINKAARLGGFRQNPDLRVDSVLVDQAESVAPELELDKPKEAASYNNLPAMSEPSVLLSEMMRTVLYASLPVLVQGRNWVLLYSTWRHGISLSTLYRRSALCPGYSLLIVGDQKGAIFGGLVEAPLQPTSKRKYQGTNDCFVFTSLPSHPVIYRPTGANNYFTLCSMDFLALGGGGHFALYLDGDLLNGSSSNSETYGNPCLSHSQDFTVKHVELWGFVYASKYDEMLTLCRTENPGICRW